LSRMPIYKEPALSSSYTPSTRRLHEYPYA
jgi:hypothetical protein